MTWVIGSSTMFGYALGIADVQATIELVNGDTKYIDCVQKIHHVGNDVAAGFCGDIENGFELIYTLKLFLSGTHEDRGWIPDFVAREWGKKAKLWFAALPEERRVDRGVEIMLMSVYPDKDSFPGQAQSYVARLRSPDFVPRMVGRSGEVISMGSGNQVREYKKVIEELNKDWTPLAGMETQNFGGFGGVVGIVVQNEMVRIAAPGISSSIQVCYVAREGVACTFPEVTVDVGTENEKKIAMPPLAKNWIEFRTAMEKHGLSFGKFAAAVA